MIVLLLAVWACAYCAYKAAARAEGQVPAADIGVLWIIILGLYATVPCIPLLGGADYAVGRLSWFQPSESETEELLTLALTYALGFCAIYVPARARVPSLAASQIPDIPAGVFLGAVVLVVGSAVLTFLISAGGLLRPSSSYIDDFRRIQELPLALRQALKFASGIGGVAQWVMLVGIFQRWQERRVIGLAFLGSVVFGFDPQGARVGLATTLLSALACWHVLVRPIPTSRWLLIGALGLLGFIAAGVFRSTGQWTEISWASVGGTEFDEVWANAVHLKRAMAARGVDLPWADRFGEIWAFIPSQLLPFDKVNLADWYVRSFYPEYAELGGGLAFGALAQAVIGAGVIEAAIRGVVLGCLGIGLLLWSRAPGCDWWRFPTYVYLFAFCFQSVRDTTFRLIAELAQNVVPTICILIFLSKLGKKPESPRYAR